MTARRVLALLAFSAAVCACARPKEDWVGRVQADALYRRADAVRESASCAKVLPTEFGRTLPVPERGASYAVLYYPATVTPDRSDAFTPRLRADFDPAAPSSADRCVAFEGGRSRDLGPAVPAGVSNDAYYRAEAKVFESLPRVAALYRSGSSSPSDRAQLNAYFDAFSTIAEPGLAPYYYRLNPDFWEWLRARGGRSLPKPPQD